MKPKTSTVILTGWEKSPSVIHQRAAVIYRRVSSGKQVKEGDGLNSQETRCRDYANYKNYQIVAIFSDDISGKFADRPGMNAMLSFMREHRREKIVAIIDDVSRLARGLRAHIDLRTSISDAGGTLESPSIEFGDDPDSQLVEHLLATVSQHHRQKNAEQTLNRMKARVQNGFWVFQAPWGYPYQKSEGRGLVLRRDGTLADVIQEALEGYAVGRFETQADVVRFLQDSPLFPKDGRGIVRHQRVGFLLANPTYAGFVEAPGWGISLRKGQHEGLISIETHQLIKQRLSGVAYMPRRQNLNEDFPLRGFVMCADCGTPLTACWSRGKTKKHPYYLCPKRGCASYGKSIRRGDIEAEFKTLLGSVEPSAGLVKVATRVFGDLWDRKLKSVESQGVAMMARMNEIEKQVEKVLDRVIEASEPRVIKALEGRVRELEEEKLLLREKSADAVRPRLGFDEALRTALAFLANPSKLWASEHLEAKRSVLKLVFSGPLTYSRANGLRTPDLSLPFKVLASISSDGKRMARPKRFELLTPRFVVSHYLAPAVSKFSLVSQIILFLPTLAHHIVVWARQTF